MQYPWLTDLWYNYLLPSLYQPSYNYVVFSSLSSSTRVWPFGQGDLGTVEKPTQLDGNDMGKMIVLFACMLDFRNVVCRRSYTDLNPAAGETLRWGWTNYWRENGGFMCSPIDAQCLLPLINMIVILLLYKYKIFL